MSKPIWVRWYPKDALDGMTMLSPLEELAYRRLLDQMFVTGDQVPDDDRALAWSTKLGRGWPRVKSRLIELGKIRVSDGFIRNRRASEVCIETASFMSQRSAAGHASVASRRAMSKLLQSNEIAATTVEPPFERDEHERFNETVNGSSTIQQTTVRKKKDIPFASLTRPSEGGQKSLPEGFDEWWAAYPRREAKDRAIRAYTKARRGGATAADLLDGLRRFPWPGDRQFIPFPATWLNDGRWRDESAAPSHRVSELRGGL